MLLTGTIEDRDFDDCGIKRTIRAKGMDKSDRNLNCQRAHISEQNKDLMLKC